MDVHHAWAESVLIVLKTLFSQCVCVSLCVCGGGGASGAGLQLCLWLKSHSIPVGACSATPVLQPLDSLQLLLHMHNPSGPETCVLLLYMSVVIVLDNLCIGVCEHVAYSKLLVGHNVSCVTPVHCITWRHCSGFWKLVQHFTGCKSVGWHSVLWSG